MDHQCQQCPTRRLCLAAGLEEDALDALSACVRPSAPLPPGHRLYRAGDPASHGFVVRSGAFKTVVLSADGEQHVTGFHFPGDLIGLSGQSTGRHGDTAVALETSTACRFDFDELPRLWEIGSGPSLLRMLGRSERRGTEGRVNLARSAADARVAGFLVALSRRMRQQGRSTVSLPLPMSRTDLANHLGMTLECLSRVLGRFRRAGLISASRTAITQHQPERLEALAGHVDA